MAIICGAYYGGVPPVPIPNTVVKPVRAEDTWRAASRENRSVPQQRALREISGLFYINLFLNGIDNLINLIYNPLYKEQKIRTFILLGGLIVNDRLFPDSVQFQAVLENLENNNG